MSDSGRRYVLKAQWVEGSQGDHGGWYEVTWNCGHTVSLPRQMLAYSGICTICVPEAPMDKRFGPRTAEYRFQQQQTKARRNS